MSLEEIREKIPKLTEAQNGVVSDLILIIQETPQVSKIRGNIGLPEFLGRKRYYYDLVSRLHDENFLADVEITISEVELLAKNTPTILKGYALAHNPNGYR